MNLIQPKKWKRKKPILQLDQAFAVFKAFISVRKDKILPLDKCKSFERQHKAAHAAITRLDSLSVAVNNNFRWTGIVYDGEHEFYKVIDLDLVNFCRDACESEDERKTSDDESESPECFATVKVLRALPMNLIKPTIWNDEDKQDPVLMKDQGFAVLKDYICLTQIKKLPVDQYGQFEAQHKAAHAAITRYYGSVRKAIDANCDWTGIKYDDTSNSYAVTDLPAVLTSLDTSQDYFAYWISNLDDDRVN